MIVVIAGTYEQYLTWLKETGASRRNAAYVTRPEQLLGLRGVTVIRTGERWTNPLIGDPHLAELERGGEAG